MAKKKYTPTHAAHIKRRTEGTSNELSFSILDAKKNQADASEGIDEKSKTPRLGKVPLFSLPMRRKKATGVLTKDPNLPLSGSLLEGAPKETSVSVPSSLTLPSSLNTQRASSARNSSYDEVIRRKSRRRKRRFALISTLLVGGVGLIVVGGIYLYGNAENRQQQAETLSQAFEKIDEADATLLKIDEELAKPLYQRDSTTLEELLLLVPDTKETLREAGELASDAFEAAKNSADENIAEQTVASVDARKQMLGAAEEVMQASSQASADKRALDHVWEDIKKGDELTRDAAGTVTVTTPENVSLSKEKNSQAKDAFDEAAYILAQLENSSLHLDIETLQNYVEKRRAACGYAIASDEAILAQDRQTAEDQNALYNAADAEAIVFAKSIPEDSMTVVEEAYKQTAGEHETKYFDMRSSASTADVFLRDYLGTSKK